MQAPVVTVTEGQLRGCQKRNMDGNIFYSFLGIPFAKPAIGELRFKAPQPAEPWIGIKEATVDGDSCYQKHDYFNYVEGSDNCLHLSVFTKTLPQNTNDLKPVLVWIYGGYFSAGSNKSILYGPEFLMTEDIVLVSINYRVGFLGFLNLNDTSLNVHGNAGLKDQQLALKWVQRNIKNFNGDPENVTIFGESAGAGCVHHHVVSPSSKGLFHKAIVQSGSVLNPWACIENYSWKFAKSIKESIKTEKEALAVLESMSVEELFAAQENLIESLGGIQVVGPTIEKPNETAVITSSPIQLLASGQYNKVPILIGYCNREGMLGELFKKFAREVGKEPDDSYYEIFPEKLIPPNMDKDDPNCKLVLKKVEDTYLQGPLTADKYLLASDYYFTMGVIASAKSHAKTSSHPVFLYRVSLDAGLNVIKRIIGISDPGVCHGDELGYLFNISLADHYLQRGQIEDIAIRRFVKLWTNFAKTGNPTPEGNDLNLTWKPFDHKKFIFLDIGTELILQTNPEYDRLEVWKEIYQLDPATAEINGF